MTLFYLAAGWLLGIFAASQIATPWWAWLIGGGLALMGAVLARHQPTPRLLLGCVLMLALGAARLGLASPVFGEHDLATYNGQTGVTLEGVIDDSPVRRDTSTSFTLRARTILVSNQAQTVAEGLVMVSIVGAQTLRYGDAVSVRGDLTTPPETDQFSYRDYLARDGIYSLMPFARVRVLGRGQGSPFQAALYAWRDAARRLINQLMPDPEASLLQGILLGDATGIDTETHDAFNTVSATHIIAISGANMVVVAGFLQFIARRVVKGPWVTVITIVGVIIYTVFVGANPAVVRAAIMTGLALTASQLGRQTYGPASLGFAALALTAINPLVLWDVSFQLTFLATFGLIYYVEPIQNMLAALLSRLLSEKTTGIVLSAVSDAVIVSVAAQFMTTPIMAAYFEQMSLVSLPVNFLIIPAQPPLMIFGGLGVMAAAVFWPPGQLLAWVSWLFLAYTVWIVKAFAALPFASVTVTNIPPGIIWGFYAVVFGATIAGQQPPEKRRAWWDGFKQQISLKAVAFAGVIGAILLFAGALSMPDGKLHVTVLDVGDGSAALVETPSGRHILIDAGGSGRALASALGDRLPFWKREIDVLVITQPGEAATAGLPTILDRYAVHTLITNGAPGGQTFGTVLKSLRNSGARETVASNGMSVRLGDGVTLTLVHSDQSLAPQDTTGEALSVIITYGKLRIVLPGSVSQQGFNTLLEAEGAANPQVVALPASSAILKGSPDLLGEIDPQVLILSTNPGQPLAPEMLAQLEQYSRALYRTDQQGSVEMITDGSRLWAQTSH